MVKTGIFNWFGYSIDNKERMKLIKEAGFDSVLLWWSDEYNDIDGDKELLPGLARKNGLYIENVHAPYENANSIWEDGIDSKSIIDIYTGCIADCAKYNIKTVVIHVSKGKNPPPFNNLGLDRFKYLTDFAEKAGVNIALENLKEPKYLEFIFSKIDSSRLGFCFDSGHENFYTKGADLLSKYGHRLMALHLHDNDGTDDQHRIPGEGTINWDKIKEAINKTNYSGSITLEVTKEYSIQYANTDASIFLKHAYEGLKKVFKLI